MVSTVKVITNEGVNIQTDYRSPAKVLGLPGSVDEREDYEQRSQFNRRITEKQLKLFARGL
jgi:hypothetical protein